MAFTLPRPARPPMGRRPSRTPGRSRAGTRPGWAGRGPGPRWVRVAAGALGPRRLPERSALAATARPARHGGHAAHCVACGACAAMGLHCPACGARPAGDLSAAGPPDRDVPGNGGRTPLPAASTAQMGAPALRRHPRRGWRPGCASTSWTCRPPPVWPPWPASPEAGARSRSRAAGTACGCSWPRAAPRSCPACSTGWSGAAWTWTWPRGERTAGCPHLLPLGGTVRLRPAPPCGCGRPCQGHEVEPTLPGMTALPGRPSPGAYGSEGPGLVRLVAVAAAECHRHRLSPRAPGVGRPLSGWRPRRPA